MKILGLVFMLFAVMGCGGGGSGDSTVTPGSASFPVVEAQTPSDDTGNANIDLVEIDGAERIQITFSEAMDPDTIDSNSMQLSVTGTSFIVPSHVSYDEVSYTATLTPLVQLSGNTEHTVTVSSTISNLDGKGLSLSADGPPVDLTYQFTTGPAVTGGYENTCSLGLGGSLYCWGGNIAGERGVGEGLGDALIPTLVADVSGDDSIWVALGSTTQTSCAVKASGRIYCWGVNWTSWLNGGGQAGIEPDVDHRIVWIPTEISSGGTDWVFAGMSMSSTCGVTGSANSLSCWGVNIEGQLGTGTTDPSYQWTAATLSETNISNTNWTTITGGNEHLCATRYDDTNDGVDNSLYCWGKTAYGVLGVDVTGLGGRVSSPVRVSITEDGSRWVKVSAGNYHNCALRANGELYCWGANTCVKPTSNCSPLGLGDSTSNYYGLPQRVGTDTWKWISSGWHHTCGVKTDGTLWCWGSNQDFDGVFRGELGIGEGVQSTVSPQQVGTDTNWAAVFTGDYHTCGVKNEGYLYCWGKNVSGELGIGNLVDQYTPVQVTTDANIARTDAE